MEQCYPIYIRMVCSKFNGTATAPKTVSGLEGKIVLYLKYIPAFILRTMKMVDFEDEGKVIFTKYS